MTLLALLYRTSPALVVAGVLATVASGASSAALLTVINEALAQPEARGRLSLVFLLVAALALAARFAADLVLPSLHHRLTNELRLRLVRQILQAPLRQSEIVGQHRLLSALVDDVQQISATLKFAPSMATHLATVLASLAWLAWLSPRASAVSAGLLVLGVGFYAGVAASAGPHYAGARRAQDVLHKHLRGLTEGVRELKTHAGRRQAWLAEELEPAVKTLGADTARGDARFALAASTSNLFFLFFVGGLLFVAPLAVELQPKVLVAFALVALYLQGPVNSLASWAPHAARAEIAHRHLASLGLALGGAPEPLEEVDRGPAPFRRLELRGVTHAYRSEEDDSPFQLGPLDLALAPGEVVFVTGGNGSGKTTLAKVLCGLYLPERGEVLLDGVPVAEGERDRYRQLFSVVWATPFVFDRLLGAEAPGLAERAGRYLAGLRLAAKVRVTGDTLSTVELSQGQRKRLALLAAYLEDRPIYVFDEWAADQDPEFKRVFYRELLPELKARGKTVVVISHDDAYFDAADRRLRLRDGRCVPREEEDAVASASITGSGRS